MQLSITHYRRVISWWDARPEIFRTTNNRDARQERLPVKKANTPFETWYNPNTCIHRQSFDYKLLPIQSMKKKMELTRI